MSGRRSLRWIAIATLAIAFALALLVAPSARDALALHRAGRDLLAETEALARRAAGHDPRAALAGLPASRWNAHYVLLDGLLEEARVSATTLGPMPPLLAFELDGSDRVGLEAIGGESRRSDGTIVIGRDRDAHLRAGGIALSTRDVGEVEIRVRTERGKRLWLSFVEDDLPSWPGDDRGPCCLQPPWDRDIRRLLVDLVPDGQFHTYRIDGSRVVAGMAMSTVRTLFIHPTDRDGDRVEIDHLRFHSRLADFARTGWRMGPATQGKETRTTIGCLAPCSLAFEVPVPAAEPRLELGWSILDGERAVDFEVAIGDASGEVALARESMTRTGTWSDRSFDLSPWKGRTATVRMSIASAASGAVGYWSNPVVYGRPERPFNVLLVVEDTLRADRLSLYGHHRRTTPVKEEQIAARGVVFEHAFSQAPATRPSVPSYMTSLYPSATGVWTFQQWLDRRYLTLADVMRSQGFATVAFSENVSAGLAGGLDQGFDRLFVDDWKEGSEGLYGQVLPRFIAANRHRNWFAYAHVLDPHGPYDPEAPFDRWYREEGPGTTPVKALRLDAPWITNPTREGRQLLYDGEIARNDRWFAEVLAALDAAGQRESTLIVFTSDHGEHFGEHRAPGDERGLYNHYAPTFASVVHVPLLLSWPGVLPEGVRVSGAVPLIDVMPTILDLAGIDRAPLVLQGHSLRPAIESGRAEWKRVIFSEEPEHFVDRDHPRTSASLFFDGWQLVASRRLDRPQRYDLVADPEQSAPLSRWLRGGVLIERVAARLLRRFADEQVVLRRELGGEDAEAAVRDPADMDRLRALGYLD